MKYFGTDGIRQPAAQFTPEFLGSIACGLADYAGTNIKVLLGGDTRESTEWILQDLAIALESLGIEYSSVGVLPTPAISYCFYQMGFDFAIDVTASHNPYTDNGIKIFERGATSGVKLSEKGCEVIENAIISAKSYAPVSPTDRADLHTEAVELYKEHLLTYLGFPDQSQLSPLFTGLHLGIDCANGATSVIGSSLFEKLGATVHLIHADSTYGTKINANCGSTHLDSLIQLVTTEHLDFGIAYDGDGDRCLLVDSTGQIVDGDQIIAILASHLGLSAIAVTVMANQGLLNWANEQKIRTEITPVGDTNVAIAMRTQNIPIGGEQSGHIILPGEPTGDGILTSLMMAKAVKESNTSLDALAKIFTKSPQVIVNMAATPAQKVSLKESATARELLLNYNKQLSAISGRLLVRPSGTEPLIRITMWGDSADAIQKLAETLKTDLERIL